MDEAHRDDDEIESSSQGSEDTLIEMYERGLKSGIIPTFEEFKKNPDAFRLAREHLFSSIDKGSTLFRNLKSHKFFFKTIAGNVYEAASLEKIQDIADQEGVLISDLKCVPELREDTSGKITCEITFVDRGVRRAEKSRLAI